MQEHQKNSWVSINLVLDNSLEGIKSTMTDFRWSQMAPPKHVGSTQCLDSERLSYQACREPSWSRHGTITSRGSGFKSHGTRRRVFGTDSPILATPSDDFCSKDNFQIMFHVSGPLQILSNLNCKYAVRMLVWNEKLSEFGQHCEIYSLNDRF